MIANAMKWEDSQAKMIVEVHDEDVLVMMMIAAVHAAEVQMMTIAAEAAVVVMDVVGSEIPRAIPKLHAEDGVKMKSHHHVHPAHPALLVMMTKEDQAAVAAAVLHAHHATMMMIVVAVLQAVAAMDVAGSEIPKAIPKPLAEDGVMKKSHRLVHHVHLAHLVMMTKEDLAAAAAAVLHVHHAMMTRDQAVVAVLHVHHVMMMTMIVQAVLHHVAADLHHVVVTAVDGSEIQRDTLKLPVKVGRTDNFKTENSKVRIAIF